MVHTVKYHHSLGHEGAFCDTRFSQKNTNYNRRKLPILLHFTLGKRIQNLAMGFVLLRNASRGTPFSLVSNFQVRFLWNNPIMGGAWGHSIYGFLRPVL